MMERRDLARRLRRLYLRRRRGLAAALAGVAVFVGVRAATPPPPATVPVAVASSDLDGGVALQAGDVRIVRMPASVVADGSFSSSTALIGRIVAAPMRAGEPLTDRRLLGRALLAGYGRGLVAAPLPIDNPALVPLLHPGDALDVYAATSSDRPAELLAAAAPVVTVPASTSDSSQTPVVVLAVTPTEAASIAAASVVAPLSITLHG